MNLNDATRRMRALMTEHGLTGWSFEFDRAVKRRGQCNYGTQTITMSRRLTELASEHEAEQTMLHEIGHALVGPGHGHGRVWLRQARAIGYLGHRTSTRENEVAAPWVATCPGCQREVGRHRRPTGTSSCGKCSGGRFNPRFVLNFERRALTNA